MAKRIITFHQNGNWGSTEKFFKKASNLSKIQEALLKQYGEKGVSALRQATPKDTGETANSWYYTVEKYSGGVKLSWRNSNVVDGVPIAIILQYGHATKNGSYVSGIDYINPAIRPIFEDMASKLWEEVMH